MPAIQGKINRIAREGHGQNAVLRLEIESVDTPAVFLTLTARGNMAYIVDDYISFPAVYVIQYTRDDFGEESDGTITHIEMRYRLY